MGRILFSALVVAGLSVAPAHAYEVAVSLKGSPASMARQNEVAREMALPFVRTPSELSELARKGELVPMEGNADYELANFVSYPQARPEMRLFIERLAAQYHQATGEKLVVTSLTRPTSRQPGNSHQLSVHPTGIAVDLRISQKAASREWLERTLLSLEERGLLDVTRERTPPHYHVALFPAPYLAHVDVMLDKEAAQVAENRALEVLFGGNAFLAAEEPAEEDSGSRSPAGLLAALLILPVTLAGAAAGLRRRTRSR